jgi:N-formylglutamate amidohydrolase
LPRDRLRPQIIEAARCFLAERQFAVVLNAPYSGGFTTGHYGCPQRQRHALQIEINRGLYMDERNYRRKPAFGGLAADMAGLIEHLGEVMREWLACTADCRR